MPETICPNCLKKLEESFAFCPFCGSPVKQRNEAGSNQLNDGEKIHDILTDYTPSEGPYFSNAAMFQAQIALKNDPATVAEMEQLEAEKEKKRRKSGGAILALSIISLVFSFIAYLAALCQLIESNEILRIIFTLISLLSVGAIILAIISLVKSKKYGEVHGILVGTAKAGRILGIIALVLGILCFFSAARGILMLLFMRL